MIHHHTRVAASLAALSLVACAWAAQPGTAAKPAAQPTPPATPAPATPPAAPTPPTPAKPATPPAAPDKSQPNTTKSELRSDGGLGERHKRIVAEATQGGHEIAFIGDSITEGWGGAGKAEWAKTWEPRHAINCGIGGDRTQHVIGRLDHDLLDALAASNNNIKWVVLMIGTNNTGGGDTAADIAEGNRAILDRLRAQLPKAKIVLMAVFPRGHNPNPQRDMIAAINTRLAKMADGKDIIYLDIGPDFMKGTEIPAEIMPDFLHLSPAGYKIWSDDLQKTITK